ncbi:MAG: hypothetical protein ABW000_07285 [Actinoplanes sp.]
MAGLGAVVGVLGLGFMGLGDAFNKTAGAGGGAARVARDMTPLYRAVAQAAKDVERAERDVADAQKAAAAATIAVSDAVSEEMRARDQLARSLADANLDVEDAIDAVDDAQRALNEAQDAGATPEDIDDLERAHRRAQQTLINSKARMAELTQEQANNALVGVEGSDRVTAAKDREADAARRLEDAQDAETEAVQRLVDAKNALNAPAPSGGGGSTAAQITKLAPSAAAAVAAIKGLKPAFDDLRLDVQQRLFAGVGGRLRELATAWLPTLHTRLGSMATTLNGLFQKFATSTGRPQFIADIAAGMESVEGLTDRVGTSVTDRLVPALGTLAAKADPFIDALGDGLGGLIDDFSAWIASAKDSGELEDFFTRAADFLHEVFAIGKDAGSIIGSIMSAIFGSADEKDPLASFSETLHDVAAWFNNPENQQKVQTFFTDLSNWTDKIIGLFDKLKPLIEPLFAVLNFALETSNNNLAILTGAVDGVAGAIQWVGKNAPRWWGSVKSGFGDSAQSVIGRAGQLADWFGGMGGKISKKTRGMWDGLKTSFKAALNSIIGGWNNLSFRLPGGSFLGMSWGGMTIGTPDIPYLAQGGIVPATPGGRPIMAGDGGEDEAVIPLSKLAGMLAARDTHVRLTGEFRIRNGDLIMAVREGVSLKGGNVQTVVGTNF